VTGISVERRPGRVVFVTGLLGHRAVVESIAQLLVNPDALDLAQAVAAAAEVCQETPTSEADDAYTEAVNALAAYVSGDTLMFHDWDLDAIATAVSERQAVAVA
jgi:hypothetical protein